MASREPLRLAYYGDDFTGSTDALEFLTRAGVRTVLFIAPPTPAQLARYEGLQAVGVAGLSRSLAPDAMETELGAAFQALKALQPEHVHYKVCSTFDSSPTVGSIGRAVAVGAAVFGDAYVPIVGGTPALGRYCVFGNLFARMGIGSAGEIHRLDRHPSMSRHPVTPADESDLRLHLGRQTAQRIGLVDITRLERGLDEAARALDEQRSCGAEAILIDLLSSRELPVVGELLERDRRDGHPRFSVGSSAVEAALGELWRKQGRVAAATAPLAAKEVSPLLVVSGSCSPVTEGQINWAQENGFVGIPWAAAETDGTAVFVQAQAALREGRSVVIFTHRGPLAGVPVPAEILGTQVGRVARSLVAATGVNRALVAGGDTSSYAARAMGIEAVEMIAALAPGAPLCRAHAPGSPLDGIEVNFKGGQVGAPDYFGAVARGRLDSL